jgi:hypothetical protein
MPISNNPLNRLPHLRIQSLPHFVFRPFRINLNQTHLFDPDFGQVGPYIFPFSSRLLQIPASANLGGKRRSFPADGVKKYYNFFSSFFPGKLHHVFKGVLSNTVG